LQSIGSILSWLEGLRLANFIAETDWAFAAVESVHVIALASLLGTIAVVDLRLLGLAWAGRPYTEVAREVLPWTWGAFIFAVMTGSLMFITQAAAYYANVAFRIKMLLLLLAGINMLIFQLITARGVARWDQGTPIPLSGKIAGMLSLTFWIAIVFFGRRIGFTMMMPE
jgi:hypothetical protein